MQLSLAGARALHLAAQGLTQAPVPATEADVLAAIRRMGGLQIDTISVVARSHYLVLWTRLGHFDHRWLDDLLTQGSLFEYWSHAMCFLPTEDYRAYRGRMLERARADLYLEKHDPKYQRAVHHVLDRIRKTGPARSIQFASAEGKPGGWWNWKPEKVALDHLFNAGVLMIARRESLQRVYDLHERVFPGWDDADTLPAEEAWRELTLKAIRALGIAFPRWIQRYFHDAFRKTTYGKAQRRILAELVSTSEIVPVSVEGLGGPAYVHRDQLALTEQAGGGELNSTVTTLLSPFDPVVRDRQRASELFNFEYRIEVYTPAPRRKYGYFTLPILYRGQLIGRLDPKAHRKEGLFEVKAIHLEPGVTVTEELAVALAKTLREFAAWHGTPEVVLRKTAPESLAETLNSCLPTIVVR